MATSQFKIFSSGDIGAPQLNGFSGSLINVLNWCLITGSGWLQPSASITNSRGDFQQAIYQQPSGSKCILYVNDANPNATPVGKEAWVTGWENISNMTDPVGTGSGQFPLPAQLLTTGHYVIRKSVSADIVPRNWTMYADSYTFYFFDLPEDTHTYYSAFFFGDFYSTYPNVDKVRCFIWGRAAENVGLATTQELTDNTNLVAYAGSAQAGPSGMAARSFAGYGSSWIGKLGDMTKAMYAGNASVYAPMRGVIGFPNMTNPDVMLTPVLVSENMASNIVYVRGKYRGMYYPPHPTAMFYDGQIITGSNELYGKTFQIVSNGQNGGMWAIEISNTVDI